MARIEFFIHLVTGDDKFIGVDDDDKIARVHARRGNFVGAAGQAARAVLEEANAVLCESGRWVCNEKRLIEAAGLTGVQPLFAEIPSEPAGLVLWVDLVAGQLGVPTGEVMPWSDAARGAEPGAAADRGRMQRFWDS